MIRTLAQDVNIQDCCKLVRDKWVQMVGKDMRRTPPDVYQIQDGLEGHIFLQSVLIRRRDS